MIPLFRKLRDEQLLKKDGLLVDIGSGNGALSEPFFRAGYRVILVDKNEEKLAEAERSLRAIRQSGFTLLHQSIHDFDFHDNYDGIVISNVLSFLQNKAEAKRIVESAFEKLNPGGFLYFTLFGTKDEWPAVHAETMSFYSKSEALGLLDAEPYFISEDYGRGIRKSGDWKTWHIFSLLYIK